MIAWLLSHLKLALYGLGMAALAVAVAFIRQSGADAEKTKQAAKDMKAASTIAQKRAEARGSTDTQLDRRVNRWVRK